jgi:glyoxylase-like metal-dependent hydrolase (beta-lactamase superfamily II)
MQYKIIPVTPFQQNCTLLWCEQTRQTAIIDPGGDAHRIVDRLHALELSPQCILLTHGHLDHAGGANELAQRLNLPIVGPHREDAFLLANMREQSAMFGFGDTSACEPDQWLEQGDEISVGEQQLEVHHCPGHTPGHVIFYHRASRLAQVGDVLFKGSIGRTDFPRGDYATLIHSIRSRLWPLGDEVIFIPGHGPESTFGEERRSNPFVCDGC